MSVIDHGNQARRRLGRTVTRNRLRLGLADGTLDPEQRVLSLPERPHLLFVCYGNICRSPMAERYARTRLEASPVSATLDSTGFHDIPDRPSPAVAVEAARAHDVDLGDHRSEQVTARTLRAADLVLLMDVRNYRLLRERFPSTVSKAAFLRVFGDGSRWSFEIADPYGGDTDTFARAYRQVATGVDGLLDRLAARPDGTGST